MTLPDASDPRGASPIDRVVLITGAGRGIGRAAAEAFARAGAGVVLCARSRREVDGTVAAVRAAGGRAEGRRADIASPRDARALVAFALRRLGRLDVLINNAGILGPRVPIRDYPLRDWRRVLGINLDGTFYVTRESLRVMSPGGLIITISSSVGRAGRGCWGAYAVSKFGAEGLTQVVADEGRDRGICAVTFNPGGTRTGMRAEAYPAEDPGRLRDPSETAAALLRLASRLTAAQSGGAFDFETLP